MASAVGDRLLRLLPILAIASCGYFNSLYNAQRSFDEARRAENRGERGAAAAAYRAAIENAAASYRGHGNGRWADDALFLIGRARYALGDHEASRAAFLTLLRERPDDGLAADAHAWLGASEAALGNFVIAGEHLDSALAGESSAESKSLAHLWRGRVRIALGHTDPWSDLDAAIASNTLFAPEAGLTLAGFAITAGDSGRARIAFDRLLRDRRGARWSDSVLSLGAALSEAFGPAFARSAIEPVARGDWPAAHRDEQLLRRAHLAAAAGDTAAAIADALELSGTAASGSGALARIAAARYRLSSVDDVSQLEDVRAILLPVIGTSDAREIVRMLRAVGVLLERAAGGGQPLALFAAAEIARDGLRAPALAARLFVACADIAPAAVWAPKALLAAAALDTDPAVVSGIAERISKRPDNPYAKAVLSGHVDAAAYQAAEKRLSQSLAELRSDALREADARDARIGSAVDTTMARDTTAVRDAMPGAARRDTTTVRDTTPGAARRDETSRTGDGFR